MDGVQVLGPERKVGPCCDPKAGDLLCSAAQTLLTVAQVVDSAGSWRAGTSLWGCDPEQFTPGVLSSFVCKMRTTQDGGRKAGEGRAGEETGRGRAQRETPGGRDGRRVPALPS